MSTALKSLQLKKFFRRVRLVDDSPANISTCGNDAFY